MDNTKKKSVSVLLPVEVYDRLKQYADEDSRSLSGEIRRIITCYLNDTNRAVVDAGPYAQGPDTP